MSDLERQLEDIFMHDSRSRRATGVIVPTRRARPARGLFLVGATAMAALALVVAVNTLIDLPRTTPLAAPTATPASSISTEPVVRCGQTTQFVAPTSTTPGSFVLSSAGRTELVTVPAGSGLAAAGGYNCVWIRPGTPAGELVEFIGIGAPGYVPPP